jgi:hypothetical protein
MKERGRDGATEQENTINPKSKIQNPKFAQLALMLGLALVTLNIGYGFEGSFKPLGQFPFRSRAFTVDDLRGTNQPVNRFEHSWLGKLPVPLPENYLLGIDQTKAEFEIGKRSYLDGQWKVGGWWYYYLYGLALKVPLGTWGLLLLAVAVRVVHRRHHAPRDVTHHAERDAYGGRKQVTWRDELVLLAPAASVLVLISSQAGSNALRYVLPAFPLIFIWLSQLGRFLEMRRFVVGIITALFLGWSIVSCLSVYPHCLAYFNALGGGPLGGHAHLVGSNIDWGQDLLYLRDWLDNHPEARPLRLAYFGLTDPKLAGIDFQLPPRLSEHQPKTTDIADSGPRPGWYAISVNYLRGYQIPTFDGTGRQVAVGDDDYTYFLQCQPVAVAGRSIYIYHITPAEADRVRAQLGLPLLNS